MSFMFVANVEHEQQIQFRHKKTPSSTTISVSLWNPSTSLSINQRNSRAISRAILDRRPAGRSADQSHTFNPRHVRDPMNVPAYEREWTSVWYRESAPGGQLTLIHQLAPCGRHSTLICICPCSLSEPIVSPP